MGKEIDLLINYPKAKRNVEERGATKSEADRAMARKFDKDFFKLLLLDVFFRKPSLAEIYHLLKILNTKIQLDLKSDRSKSGTI